MTLTLQEEIRNNSGISEDIVYLEEGIVFFKNSSKMKRLGKSLAKKHEKLVKKGDIENAKALAALVHEIDVIAEKFRKVEEKYKNTVQKSKVKAEYADLETEYKKLITIAKKDSTKKALIATGGLVLVAGVLVAALFGFDSLYQAGTLDNAAGNIEMRAEKSLFNKEASAAIANSKGGLDAVSNMATRAAGNTMYDQVIKATNKDLVKTVSAAGATVGGLLGVGVMSKLQKMGTKNKTISSTVKVLQDLKAAEKFKKKGSSSEGDVEAVS